MISFLNTPTPGIKTPTIERALNSDDMAAAFGSSTKTIYGLCRAGRIPGAFKTALGWRVSASNWREFLNNQETASFVSTRKLKGGRR